MPRDDVAGSGLGGYQPEDHVTAKRSTANSIYLLPFLS
jgi:hypothetical protein